MKKIDDGILKGKKFLFVATVAKTHICEFHLPYIRYLKSKGAVVDVAARYDFDKQDEKELFFNKKEDEYAGLNEEKLYKRVAEYMGASSYTNVSIARNPYSPDNIKAFKKLREVISEGNYDVIHCHTPMGALLTRLAAIGSNSKVIYTAHGLHFYKGAPLKNWLAYFPAEFFTAFFTDVLITINKEDYKTAKRVLFAKKVLYARGVGIDTEKFAPDAGPGIKEALRKRLGIPVNAFVCVSVGEFIDRKNFETAIKAVDIAKNDVADKGKNRKICYYLIGDGANRKELEALVDSLDLKRNVKFTGYRRDVALWLLASDVFLFPSIQEGLPVAVMEAMSAELPVICRDIRGCNELIINGSGGFRLKADEMLMPVVFAEKIEHFYDNPEDISEMGAFNQKWVQKYDIKQVLKKVISIYKSLLK